MFKNRYTRIVIGIIAGIVFSFILCSIFISFGYYKINSDNLNNYIVNIAGLPIYKIALQNNELKGQAINQNMTFIGIICSITFVFIIEIISYFRKRGRNI